MIYCDTSFLFSLYVADRWSDLATRLVGEIEDPIVWTPWHELEFVAALEARVGRGDLMRDQADEVIRNLAKHRDSGFLCHARPDSWPDVFRCGSELAAKYGAKNLNRGMDVFHVALCERLGVKMFWSMDVRQRDLAEDVGLEVNDLA